MFMSFDTDTRGACIALRALAEINISDGLNDPTLATEIIRRVSTPSGLNYRTEPVDEWSTAGAERWRDKRKGEGPRRRANVSQLVTLCGDSICGLSPSNDLLLPWGIDCEEYAALVAAAAVLLAIRRPDLIALLRPVEVCITQPRDHRIAHAYNRIGGRVVDRAVPGGMRPPPPGFYDMAETAAMEVTVPEFSIWRPRAEAA